MRRLTIIGGLVALVLFAFWLNRDTMLWRTTLIEARGTVGGSLLSHSPSTFFLAAGVVPGRTDSTEVWALVGLQESRLDGHTEIALLKVQEVRR